MTVITISGKEIDKKHTRKIKSISGEFKYYKIGNINIKDSGDCYQINNIYYTIEKGRIEWDNYLNQYALKTSLHIGIIDENYNRGYFSKNAPELVILYLSKEPTSEYCISKKVAINLGLLEGENNLFYNPSYYSYEDIIPRKIIDSSYKNSLPYNFKPVMDECISKFKNYKINENLINQYQFDSYSKYLNNYTFGIELETIKGVIPNELCEQLGVRPVRDGSISGLEYVTIPLSGKKGFSAFIEIIELVNKYTSSNYTCSMHIHIGGIPRTEMFITAMYKMMYYLQNDIYELFPRYKYINDGTKRMCYTAPLSSHLMSSLNYRCQTSQDIKNDYTNIVYELSGKHSSYSKYVPLSNITSHPSDPSESSKWYMKERYKILNLIPLIFTNKSTIEYRIFTVPNTIDKAISFLILSLIITDFVKNHASSINQEASLIKPYNLMKLLSNTINDTNVFYDIQRRQSIVNDILNNKGGFFEEKDVTVQNNNYAKKMGSHIDELLQRAQRPSVYGSR